MESLLHSTSNLGFTMLHIAAQVGNTEVLRIAIDEYQLDPNARTKVCGQTWKCLAKSSRASGGLCDGRWHVIDVYEHGWNWDRSIEWWQWLGMGCMLVCPVCSCRLALSPMNFCTDVMWTSVLLAFLCLHSWSCFMLCFLKMARTPVMLAALKGHTGVVHMLVHKYNCSLSDVTNEVSAFGVLCCQSPVGVRCHKCTSVSLPSLVPRLSEVISVGAERTAWPPLYSMCMRRIDRTIFSKRVYEAQTILCRIDVDLITQTTSPYGSELTSTLWPEQDWFCVVLGFPHWPSDQHPCLSNTSIVILQKYMLFYSAPQFFGRRGDRWAGTVVPRLSFPPPH